MRATDGVEALGLARGATAGGGRARHPAPRHGRLGGARPSSEADPATADIPVVVASVVDERARGLALGAAAYLFKPVSRDDLLGALRMRGRRAAVGPRSRARERRADPRGRGQPAQPQAGPRRARRRRVRRGGGGLGRGGPRARPSAAARPGPDGPPAARHRRSRDDAPAAAGSLGRGRPGGRGHRVRDGRGPGQRRAGRLRRLPREADQRARAGRPGGGLPRRGAGHDATPQPTTVLAVDDQPQNLRLLDAVLSPRGYRVVTAGVGQEALALLEDAGRRPGAARHRDAGTRRVRGLPPDPRRRQRRRSSPS